jgi:hypothetical protein
LSNALFYYSSEGNYWSLSALSETYCVRMRTEPAESRLQPGLAAPQLPHFFFYGRAEGVDLLKGGVDVRRDAQTRVFFVGDVGGDDVVLAQ